MFTAEQPAVIATRPASAPLTIMLRSGLPMSISDTIVALKTPAAAASVVLTATSAIVSGVAAIALPALKPNQPSQSRNMPRAAMVWLWPGMGFILPSFLNLFIRGPSTIAPVSAAHPPTEWTTVEPAKSTKPIESSHPPPHIQCPVMG